MGGKKNMSNDTTKIEETQEINIAMTELIEEVIKLRLKELEYIKAIKTLNGRLKTKDIFDTSKFLKVEKFDIEAISYYYQKSLKTASLNMIDISYDNLVKSQKITGWDLKFLIAYILPAICY